MKIIGIDIGTMTISAVVMDSFDDISSIGLTGQMHGIVYVDR